MALEFPQSHAGLALSAARFGHGGWDIEMPNAEDGSSSTLTREAQIRFYDDRWRGPGDRVHALRLKRLSKILWCMSLVRQRTGPGPSAI